jgi:hypothetical protein
MFKLEKRYNYIWQLFYTTAAVKIRPSLKPNHHNQIKLVKICNMHKLKCTNVLRKLEKTKQPKFNRDRVVKIHYQLILIVKIRVCSIQSSAGTNVQLVIVDGKTGQSGSRQSWKTGSWTWFRNVDGLESSCPEIPILHGKFFRVQPEQLTFLGRVSQAADGLVIPVCVVQFVELYDLRWKNKIFVFMLLLVIMSLW